MASFSPLVTVTPSLLNPWDLSPREWFAGYVCVRAVLLLAVEGLVFLSARVLPKLPTRTGPKPPYVHPLGRLDVLYLLINSFIEFVFVNQILWLLWHSPLARLSLDADQAPRLAAAYDLPRIPQVMRAGAALSLLNGPAALWLLLVTDDMLYAPTHRLMHWAPVYKYARPQPRAAFLGAPLSTPGADTCTSTTIATRTRRAGISTARTSTRLSRRAHTRTDGLRVARSRRHARR